jgi:lipopolysaccharide export system protein LptA
MTTTIRDLKEKLKINADTHEVHMKMKNNEIDTSKKEIELLKEELTLYLQEAESAKNEYTRSVTNLKKQINDGNVTIESRDRLIESLKASVTQEKERYSSKGKY